MPQYPTARDLMEALPHCSACADTNSDTDDGYTECCNKRWCTGADPATAQGPCCPAVGDRLEAEAAEGGAPARSVTAPPAAPAKPARTPRRSARISQAPATLAAPAPQPTPQEPAVAQPAQPPRESRATKDVFRNLQKDRPDTFEPVGKTFAKEKDLFVAQAKSWLGEHSRLRHTTIDGADWDAVFAYFVTEEEIAADAARRASRTARLAMRQEEEKAAETETPQPAPEPAPAPEPEAPAAPAQPEPAPEPEAAPAPRSKDLPPAAPRAVRRAPQGQASAPGWELLYDKPKDGCEVGRRWEGGKPAYALICKATGHVHPLNNLLAERAARREKNWCTCDNH